MFQAIVVGLNRGRLWFPFLAPLRFLNIRHGRTRGFVSDGAFPRIVKTVKWTSLFTFRPLLHHLDIPESKGTPALCVRNLRCSISHVSWSCFGFLFLPLFRGSWESIKRDFCFTWPRHMGFCMDSADSWTQPQTFKVSLLFSYAVLTLPLSYS